MRVRFRSSKCLRLRGKRRRPLPRRPDDPSSNPRLTLSHVITRSGRYRKAVAVIKSPNFALTVKPFFIPTSHCLCTPSVAAAGSVHLPRNKRVSLEDFGHPPTLNPFDIYSYVSLYTVSRHDLSRRSHDQCSHVNDVIYHRVRILSGPDDVC